MKIGIITHYYKSINYGGVLQAYALCDFLNAHGYQAEQICYVLSPRRDICALFKRVVCEFPFKLMIKICKKFITFAEKQICFRRHRHYICTRAKQQEKFIHLREELTPNNHCAITDATIHTVADDYDCFITGSDQVWNLNYLCSPFFLDFVPAQKKKMSYAASISMSSLSKKQKAFFCDKLQDYTAVSVREKSALSLLDGLSPVPAEVVADPVLLLSRKDWNQICADRIVEGDYIFCYYLGTNKRSREICRQFADQHGFTIINLPMASDGSCFCDDHFGDVTVTPNPEEFISLIKYASYIFTDSFHAVVFSQIYNKQYFVFKREENDTMSSRITDIVSLFGTEERYCAGKLRETLSYLNALPNVTYEENPKLRALIDKSKAFLLDNLKK